MEHELNSQNEDQMTTVMVTFVHATSVWPGVSIAPPGAGRHGLLRRERQLCGEVVDWAEGGHHS